jgi:polysaccharide export outer membrane protein
MFAGFRRIVGPRNPGIAILALVLMYLHTPSAWPAASGSNSSTLGPGDVIRITVFGHPDLATIARINEDGAVSLPLIGDVSIAGMTTARAENDIARRLQRGGFVQDAQVSLFVEQARQTLQNSVLALGYVEKPGKYPLQSVSVDGVQTLVDLLAVAGGPTQDAADYLMLIRRNGASVNTIRVDLTSLLSRGELQQNAGLVGGDIVYVPENDVFYIFGQVQHPGRYRLERNMTVMQAISVGGGITPRGSEKGVDIKRQRKDGRLDTLRAGLDDPLQPNDVVYVRESLF